MPPLRQNTIHKTICTSYQSVKENLEKGGKIQHLKLLLSRQGGRGCEKKSPVPPSEVTISGLDILSYNLQEASTGLSTHVCVESEPCVHNCSQW